MKTDPWNRQRAGVSCALGSRVGRLSLSLATALAAMAVIAVCPATAVFTRPFVKQITGSPSGPFGEVGGIGGDASNHVWISEPVGGDLFKFNATGTFVEEITLGREENLTPAYNLEIRSSDGDFYVTGRNDREGFAPYVEVFDPSGKLIKRFGKFGASESGVHVAISDSAGLVYVSHGGDNPSSPDGDGLSRGVEKVSVATDECTPFTLVASYIDGCVITGTPSENFKSFAGAKAPEAVAVDGAGRIYVVNNGVPAVDEYLPSGEFVRAFSGVETPGVSGNHKSNGFGGVLRGIVVDPVSGHLLVAVSDIQSGMGAIDEFDVSSGRFLDQITAAAERDLRVLGELTADGEGDVYVVETGDHVVDEFGPGHFLPTLKLQEAGERTPSSAVLHGTVNPEGFSLTQCNFEYVTESAFDAEGFAKATKSECDPSAAAIETNDTAQAVSAVLSGLTPGVTYMYRLVATSSGELGGTGQSEVLGFTTPHAPAVQSTTVTNLSSEFADFHARIDPLGADTTYFFQYVDDHDFDATGFAKAAVTPEVDIGAGGPTGGAAASVVRQVGGLVPSTAYHVRVIAQNSFGVTDGPEVVFATMPVVAPGLPDGRGYEQVTPANKGSAEDMFTEPEVTRHEFANRDVGFPAQSGEAFLLETFAAFGPDAASAHNSYVFTRTGSSWQTTSLAVPALGVQSLSAGALDPVDLSAVGINASVGSAASTKGTSEVSMVGPAGGPYMTLHEDPGVHFGERRDETQVVGASHDLGTAILESRDHTLAHGAEGQDAETRALYEWKGGPGLSFVNVNSKGTSVSRCGAVLGQGGHQDIVGAASRAVSADGSKVLFTAPDPYVTGGLGCWKAEEKAGKILQLNPPELYMRSGGETVEISAPESPGVVDPTGPHPAVYVGAAEDDSKVFFVTEAELTKEAVELGLHNPELYEYDVRGGKLTRISSGELGGSEGDVLTVPAVSADGSAVYFTANGHLTSDTPPLTGEEVNLYRFDTVTGKTAYVTTVNSYDYPDNAIGGWWAGKPGMHMQIEMGLDPKANWYATPDGRHLVFGSTRDLTGYDTTEASKNDCPSLDRSGELNGHCAEIYRYRYDAASNGGEVVCVSCNPSGAPPVSHAFFGHEDLPGRLSTESIKAMSDDGSLVFFATADALVPQDGNGTLDVYEWHDGRISLISGGQDPSPSYFLGQSSAQIGGRFVEAANVFFGTHGRLVPADNDTAGDLYDARIGGGFPPPASESSECEGDACQSPPATPIDATPASVTFAGPEDIVEATSHPKKKSRHKKRKRKKATRDRSRKAKRSLRASHRGKSSRRGGR